MALTKSQVRTQVRQLIDDPNAKRWNDASLDSLIEGIHDDIYSDILDTAPYFNTGYQQIAAASLHSPGYIDLRQTIYGGDLTQRFYRLQQCIADGRHYFAKDPRDFLMIAGSQTNDVTSIRADQGVEQRFSYQFLGNQLWLHPLGSVGTMVELRYNFKPQAFTSLTNGYIVDMPEGSYRALINLAAAEGLQKGNAEDAQAFLRMGEDARQRLLNSIRRQTHGPMQMWTGSNPQEFGGV